MRKYLSIAKANFLNRIAYPADFLFRAIFVGVILFIFVNMWEAVYSSSNATIIEGFTVVMVIWYLVMSEAIVTSNADVLGDITGDVQTGDIAYKLNKPYSYIMYHFSTAISTKVISFLVTFTIGSLLVYLLVGGFDFNTLSIPLIAVSVLLALILDFFMVACIALLAFWFEETKPFYWIYTKIIFTIGGMLLPLDLFPKWLASFSAWLPFSFAAYHPAKLFVKYSSDYALMVVSWQLIYIIAFSLIAYVIYRIGARRLNINGG